MVTQYLIEANSALKDLIEVTQRDIEDVKKAEHDSIFERSKIKEELLKNFENKKAIIDNEIVALSNRDPQSSLEELLDDEQRDLLGDMRNNLENLKKLNKRLASLVFSVSEFYDSLLSKLIPRESVGYDKNAKRQSSFLQVRG